jgi:hypothetical protein
MMSNITLSVNCLSIIMLSYVKLVVVMLRVVMIRVVMLSVIKLNVAALDNISLFFNGCIFYVPRYDSLHSFHLLRAPHLLVKNNQPERHLTDTTASVYQNFCSTGYKVSFLTELLSTKCQTAKCFSTKIPRTPLST